MNFRRKPEASVPQMAVMIFRGEYDIATAARLRADLNRLRDLRRVVLDFTDVTYLDSKAIHELSTCITTEREGLRARDDRLSEPHVAKDFSRT